MLKFIGNLLGKVSLSAVARNLDVDIDTVQKADGIYIRVRVEAFDFKLLDRLIKIAELDAAKDLPRIDVFETNRNIELEEWSRKADSRLLKTANKGKGK